MAVAEHNHDDIFARLNPLAIKRLPALGIGLHAIAVGQSPLEAFGVFQFPGSPISVSEIPTGAGKRWSGSVDSHTLRGRSLKDRERSNTGEHRVVHSD
jgi:hypothetical protein